MCHFFSLFLLFGTMSVCFHNRVALGPDTLYLVPGTWYVFMCIKSAAVAAAAALCCYAVVVVSADRHRVPLNMVLG